jgi:hypothetical protein
MAWLNDIKLMGEDPWEFYWCIRPLFNYCLESASQVEETYRLLECDNILADQDHEDILGRVHMFGYTEEQEDKFGPCPRGGYFLLTQLESIMIFKPYKRLKIIDVLLYSLEDDDLRGLLRNFYIRLFDESFDPDISWMINVDAPQLKKYNLRSYLDGYIIQFQDTYS